MVRSAFPFKAAFLPINTANILKAHKLCRRAVTVLRQPLVSLADHTKPLKI